MLVELDPLNFERIPPVAGSVTDAETDSCAGMDLLVVSLVVLYFIQ